jgi:predicted kinase
MGEDVLFERLALFVYSAIVFSPSDGDTYSAAQLGQLIESVARPRFFSQRQLKRSSSRAASRCAPVESPDGALQMYPLNTSPRMLIIFGGLPATGKTTIARDLARELGATYLRIDTIEQALFSTMSQPTYDEGYRVAYAVAEDNLRLGRTVISDSVNPIQLSRDAWIGVAHRVGARAVEVEVICSDPQLHRRRVEARSSDIAGLSLPTWEEVVSREYEPWEREHLVIDTAGRSVAECVAQLREKLPM